MGGQDLSARMEDEKPSRGGGAEKKAHLPRLNFRPLLAGAISLIFGILLYFRIRIGGLSLSDFLIFGMLFLLLLPPWKGRRLLAIALVFVVFASLGALSAHIYTEKFLSGPQEGTYTVEGTVERFSRYDGYTSFTLKNITLDGAETGGKLSANTSGDVRTGDIVKFTAYVRRAGLNDTYEFTENIRYVTWNAECVRTDLSADPFLRCNAALYERLHRNMHREEADMGYALLTGQSGNIDTDVMQNVRSGGIAHIFAVSGLHIGIVYGAALLLSRPLRRYAFVPALLLGTAYAGLCGFSVSAVRALIMCAALSLAQALGRKSDMLNSLSLAALPVLLFSPAQLVAVGFLLSFGACLGLFLFSGSLQRLFKRIRMPAFLAGYLSASLSVQIVTLPVLLEAFGSFSLWGIVLNLVVVPLLPVLLAALLLGAFLALVLPFWAGGILLFPEGLLALFLLFLRADLSYTLTGFALGAGGVVFFAAVLCLNGRVRMNAAMRAATASLAAVLLSLTLVYANVVPYGCRITVQEGVCFIETREERVLVVGESTLSDCEQFLRRTDGDTPTAVVMLSDGSRTAALFLPAERTLARTGEDRGVETGEFFEVGSVSFRFFGEHTLLFFAEGRVVAFTIEENAEADADLCIKCSGESLKYFLSRGIIYEEWV